MPDSVPPRRAGPSPTRRRSMNAPTVGTVPTVNPAVTRYPGLGVPGGAFGGGIGEGLETPGQTVSGFAEDVTRAEERRPRHQAATERARIFRVLTGKQPQHPEPVPQIARGALLARG